MSVRSRSAIPLSARRVVALSLAFAAGIAAVAAADEPRGCLLALAAMLLPAMRLAVWPVPQARPGVGPLAAAG